VKRAEEFSSTASWYRSFATHGVGGYSPIYEGLSFGVADDPDVVALIAQLPRPKQQPNLILACARLLGAPLGPYSPWRDWLVANWDAVHAEALVRSTQTNEPRRSAILLPALALIAGPIALLEVGASGGLCLFPDRYSYDWESETGEHSRLDPADGQSPLLLECLTTGNPPLPTTMPEIVWRAGLDLNPIDLSDPDAADWLETLVWPEQVDRLARIRLAMDIVRAERPRIVRGDATAGLAALAAEAPKDATLVIQNSAAIVYLTPENRADFIELVTGMDARWVSNEGPVIVPSALAGVGKRVPPEKDEFLLALDGHPLAWVGPHGQRLDWLEPRS
jgi:hypothetical protein